MLSLCIRYLNYNGEEIKITEGRQDFTDANRGTAAHLVGTIKEQLAKCGQMVET